MQRVRRGKAGDGGDDFAVDFNGDGALEEFDANDDAPETGAAGESSFQAVEGTLFDADALAGAEKGPGHDGSSGGDDGSYGVEL